MAGRIPDSPFVLLDDARSGKATPMATNTPPQPWLKRRPLRCSQGLMRCAAAARAISKATSITA